MKNLSQHLNESFESAENTQTPEVILENGTWSTAHYRLVATIDGVDVITQANNSNNLIPEAFDEAQLKEVAEVVKVYKKLDKELQRPYLEVFGHYKGKIHYCFSYWKFFLSSSFNSWQLGTTFDKKEIEKFAKTFEHALITKSTTRDKITFEIENGTFSYYELSLNFSSL